MSARDKLEAAVARAEAAPPAVPPFHFNIAMDAGRTCSITLPGDTTDTELVQLIGIIAGPGRVELVAQQAKAVTRLVRATSMPRPV